MNFDIMNAKTIYESDVINKCVKESANYSETNINVPVSNTVLEAMKINASNPENLKIVATTGEKPAVYIEAFEFFTFCEAVNKPFDEAANQILEKYISDNPELENAEFHVVFPSECINKNILGGENLGKAINNDWPMQLIRGCRRYGLKVNIGKESDYPNNVEENDNDEKESINNESSLVDQIDNMVNKTVDKVNKEAEERKKVMDKIEEAKKAVEEYNAKKKKDKQKKYSEIKNKKE